MSCRHLITLKEWSSKPRTKPSFDSPKLCVFRTLHEEPELMWEEEKTSAFLRYDFKAFDDVDDDATLHLLVCKSMAAFRMP